MNNKLGWQKDLYVKMLEKWMEMKGIKPKVEKKIEKKPLSYDDLFKIGIDKE